MTSTGSSEQPAFSCPHCGAANPAGFRFCGSCGRSLERVCPSCGNTVPGGFRFCGFCGSSLDAAAVAAAAPREERKVVTVLFADLAASTELAARLDPEELRNVLRPYFDAMAAEVSRFGGTVEKFIGDAVVALFGAPVAHEDDPIRAIACALGMHDRLRTLNAELASRDVSLSMRVGINTGEVVADPEADRQAIVTGEAVNVAARFQALAPAGGIVVGERTERDARQAYEFRLLDEVTVKGIDRPLPAWEVVGPHTQEAADERPRIPLVGRKKDLELLDLLMARTMRESRPNLVTIMGPAGIGKSRLAREFESLIAEGHDDVRVVRGKCLPYGEGLTYWPLAEILKADAAILDNDPPEVILEKARDVLGGRLGERGRGFANILLESIGVHVGAAPLGGAERDTARDVIHATWRRYFEAMAAESPVLADIEDLHWADRALLDLIEELMSSLEAPVLMLCQARPELTERRPGWGGGLGNATTIALSPLTEEEGRELIDHLLGGEAPGEVAELVLGRAEGNPFFAEELVRVLIDDGYLEREDEGGWSLKRDLPASLPDTVQGVVAARLDLLPAAEKRALQDAAVVGRTFWRGAVERLGGHEEALDALVRKGLVREQAASTFQGDRELSFTHVLFRDVAYQSIPRGRRPQLHADFGTWVEEATHGRADEFAEILAYHFELAGDRARTGRYAYLAGQRKLRVFAAEEAITWFERALEAMEDDPDVEELRAQILLGRGGALEQLARFSAAKDDYERALEIAAAEGDSQLEVRSLAALAHIHWLQDRYEEGRRITRAALDKAREIGATDLLARILYTAGVNAFGRTDWSEAESFQRESLEFAEGVADEEGMALAHHGLCETLVFTGRYSDALTHGTRSAELLDRLGHRPMLHHNEHMLGWSLLMLGRLDEAMQAYEAGAAGSHDVGDRRSEAVAVAGMAIVTLFRGDVARSMAHCDEAARIGAELEAPRVRLIASMSRLQLFGELGAWEALEKEIEAGFEYSDAVQSAFLRPRLWAMRGWLALARGDADGAEFLARARKDSADSAFEALWCSFIEFLGTAMLPDAAAVERAANRLIALSEPESDGIRVWGMWGRALAGLLRGDAEEAVRLAEVAVESARRVGIAIIEWRALETRARALEALDRPEEAAADRRSASDRVSSIASRIEDQMLRAGFLARPEVAGLHSS